MSIQHGSCEESVYKISAVGYGRSSCIRPTLLLRQAREMNKIFLKINFKTSENYQVSQTFRDQCLTEIRHLKNNSEFDIKSYFYFGVKQQPDFNFNQLYP